MATPESAAWSTRPLAPPSLDQRPPCEFAFEALQEISIATGEMSHSLGNSRRLTLSRRLSISGPASGVPRI